MEEKRWVKCTVKDCLNSSQVERTEQQWQACVLVCMCVCVDQCLLCGLLSVCSAYSAQTMHGGEPELMQYRDQLKASFDAFQVCKLVCVLCYCMCAALDIALTCFFSSPPFSLSYLISPYSV